MVASGRPGETSGVFSFSALLGGLGELVRRSDWSGRYAWPLAVVGEWLAAFAFNLPQSRQSAHHPNIVIEPASAVAR